MKIAFVYDAVYPWIKGGAEKRIYEIGTRLAASGDEVHLFGINWWDGEDVIEYDGMVLHGVCAAQELYVNGRRSVTEALVFSLKLVWHMFREKFDVIDVSVFPYFSCFGVKCVSLLRRTPVVFTWHEVWGNYWYEYLGRIGFFGKMVERLVIKLSSNVVAVSSMTKIDLEGLGMDIQKVQVVSNGINLDEIARIEPLDDVCDILFAGRLIKEKNVDVLLEAVGLVRKDIPDVMCCIIGDGPEREKLVELAHMRGLFDDGNVKFFDFLEYGEVIARIKSSKVLVLPSSREGFGMVVVEAFACGVPVVTVDAAHNAATELVDGTCGSVVELDASAIAGAVLELLGDAGYHEKMARGAQERAQGYGWDRIVSELRMGYEGLV
ncbi:MAG: glycosyltransferase family 4 protein [ANME-2 cluster archaeon]|nr:glycosyltransferase family 4 protein [ANME-2 cluster archaeon]MBC2709281.1 glycosyltransferase family 4 protein [ANME-2 cluster archaeon]MBC2745973.1 glycosyltransferase family 4 protein [ANME-2 cluster archaeon]